MTLDYAIADIDRRGIVLRVSLLRSIARLLDYIIDDLRFLDRRLSAIGCCCCGAIGIIIDFTIGFLIDEEFLIALILIVLR